MTVYLLHYTFSFSSAPINIIMHAFVIYIAIIHNKIAKSLPYNIGIPTVLIFLSEQY